DLLDALEVLRLDAHPLHRRLQLAGIHPPARNARDHGNTERTIESGALGFAACRAVVHSTPAHHLSARIEMSRSKTSWRLHEPAGGRFARRRGQRGPVHRILA